MKNRSRDFEILASVQYKDGAPMLSVTGALVKPEEREDLMDALSYSSWEFRMPSTSSPISVEMGQITLREHLLLDRMAGSDIDVNVVKQELGFDAISGLSIDEFYEKFKLFARHYPSFLEVST